jgi:hypothetical protein
LIIKFTRIHLPHGSITYPCELISCRLLISAHKTVTLIRLVYTNLFSCQTSSSGPNAFAPDQRRIRGSRAWLWNETRS